jgi:hypothetical protein
MKTCVCRFVSVWVGWFLLVGDGFGATVLRRGLDYAFPPRPTAAGVKSAGYSFVVRYVGGSASKQITLAEANELKGAGVDLILVFESTANRVLSGESAGVTDANTAISQASAAGAPANFFCYFACDFDAQLADQAAINAYLDGVASVFGGYARIGFYGGYNPLKRVLDAGKAAKGWQTLAWSAGLKDPRIALYQTGGTVVIDGATCDVDEAYIDDLGQWTIPRGALQVSLQPSGAVSAGAQWRVDGGAWQNSGAILRGLSLGNHTVTFKPVSGLVTPSALAVMLSTSTTMALAVAYGDAPASVQVTLGPAGAVNAGAQWRVDNGAWQNSGATVGGLAVGNHTISFTAITGWITPAATSVSLSANFTDSVTIAYTEAPTALIVTLGPGGAINAGAQWSLDGGPWQPTGGTNWLTAGNHIVSFKPVEGWVTPFSQNVAVYAGETTFTVGSYSESTEVRLTEALRTVDGFQFNLHGPVGNTYVTQASTDFVSWQAMATNMIPPGGAVALSDSDRSAAIRFYRVVRKDTR